MIKITKKQTHEYWSFHR